MNVKVLGHSSRSRGLFVCLLPAQYCLNRCFTQNVSCQCHSLDGAALIVPPETTGTTQGQYLALSKA